MTVNRRIRESISLPDRLAAALGGMFAAGITVLVVLAVLFVVGGLSTSRLVIYSAAAFIALGGAIGLLFGPERTANFFGMLWGSVESTQRQTIAIDMLLLIVFTVVVLVFVHQ